jgi:hypothetical protein
MRRVALSVAIAATFATCAGCRDLSGFSTNGDIFVGAVVNADFVRAGVAPNTQLCLALDADHFQGQNGVMPGDVSTDDGRFHLAKLRPIPQIWSDPLSTLTFGEGRLKNLVYVVAATTPFGDLGGDDVFAVVSLMQSGGVEVRLLRGAPSVSGEDAGDAAAGDPSAATGASNVFAIFALSRKKGPCSF